MSVKVELREHETVDNLIKRFKNQVRESGILLEVSKRQYFLKKALKRKQKAKMARIKARNR